MRLGREHWIGQVEAWRSSGLSQAEYCKRHQVVYNTMNGWARRLAAEREDADRPLVELKASPTNDRQRPGASPGDRAGGGGPVSAAAVARDAVRAAA